MSEKLKDVLGWLNRILKPGDFEDIAFNGLQVEAPESAMGVDTVGFAVDATTKTIQAALDADCDLLVVHHGLFWGPGVKSIRGVMAKRLELLLGQNLSLYGSHLPLDAHPKHGNNISLAYILNVALARPFCKSHGQKIGFSGTLEHKPTASELASELERKLMTKVRIVGRPDANLFKVGVVTGCGTSAVRDVVNDGLDALITGEVTYEAEILALETGKVIICAGHYETETFGVKIMSEVMSEALEVETVFLDVKPN